jgi:hypothetical protein
MKNLNPLALAISKFGKPAKPSKYKNKPTNGYASKAEAAYAQHLEFMKRAGKVLDWLEQVPIKLPGKIRYVCDFLVFYADGTTRFVEIKGFEAPTWKLKRKLLQEARPEIYAKLDVIKK